MTSGSRLALSGLFVVVALVCARLGVWQVSRLRERRAANAVAMRARAAPPLELTSATEDSSLAGRRVRVNGRYDHAHDIVLRNREYQGVPGVELISPLVLQGDSSAILVDRGFVPAPDAVTVDPAAFREAGPKKVEGVLIPISSGRGLPLTRHGVTSWARLDFPAVRQALPYQLSAFSILQSPDSGAPQFPRRQALPPLDDGPHLNYAIQWFSFSVIALVFAIIMARSRGGPADRPRPTLVKS
jgi:surfeit locus 1 family protein